jgi:hypothetical protein
MSMAIKSTHQRREWANHAGFAGPGLLLSGVNPLVRTYFPYAALVSRILSSSKLAGPL